MNHAVFMGRLTRDPEVRYSQGENSIAIARYSLAVNRIGRSSQNNNEQTADFINCVAFDKAGEFTEKYFRQGMRVLVSGRIQTGSYTNKEGIKVYTTDLIIQTQEFADSKSASGDGSQSTSRPEPSQADADGFTNIPDGVEDPGLPFN